MERLKTILENVFCGDRLKKFCEDLFFFWRALALVSLVLGLEHSCPWPRECLSSKGCPWPRIFFVSLALASSLVSSTPPLVSTNLMVVSTNLFRRLVDTIRKGLLRDV